MDHHKYNTHTVKSRCENKLKINFRKNKEFNGWFEYDGRKICRITIPTGRKPIPPKTYKSFANQLKVSVDFFDGLMRCPNSYKEYIEALDSLIKVPPQIPGRKPGVGSISL